LHHLVRRGRARDGHLQPVRAGFRRPLPVAAHRRARRAGLARAQGPPHPRDFPGPGHRAPLSDRWQWRRADGAALYRADSGQGPAPGWTMKRRALTFGILVAGAATLAALGVGRLAAHEPGDLQFIPMIDRFALAEAFRRGGAAERDALEAELAPI